MNNQAIEKTMTSMATSFDIWDGSIATGFAGGNGTEEEPYLINTASQLAYLTQGVSSNLYPFNKKYYELTANLDLAGIEWTPIGTSSLFSIFFDGKNHMIKGLAVHSEDSWKGLFSNVNVVSYIKNLNVTDAYVSGRSWVGGIVGQMNGTLENCHFSGQIVGQSSYIGGIVGQLANGPITGCSNSSTISGSNILNTCGGIVGWASSGSVLYCQNRGALDSNASTGGIAGKAKDIRYCSNAGTVSGKSNTIGGIVGDGEVIEGCMNTGTISGGSTVGGIAGEAKSVIHSFNMAEIKGNSYLGGILGRMSYYVDTIIQNCYNIGMITGNNYAGGIVPQTSTSKSLYVTDCYNHGMITANNYKGALLGYVSSLGKKPVLTNTYYLLGSADKGVGTGVAEYEESVVTILDPQPVLALLSETIKKLLGDSIDLVFTVGKELLNEIIKVVESFYKLLEELAASEGSRKEDYFVIASHVQGISIRNKPSVNDSEVIGTFNYADTFKIVLDENNNKIIQKDSAGDNWIKVKSHEGTIGWFKEMYVLEDKAWVKTAQDFPALISYEIKYLDSTKTPKTGNLTPIKTWWTSGDGEYNGQPLKTRDNMYYRVAVAPKILHPYFADDKAVEIDDFDAFSRYIQVELREKNNHSNTKILKCFVVDLKAHTFGKYPDNLFTESSSSVKSAKFEYTDSNGNVKAVENGLVQTGIKYPKSHNPLVVAVDNVDASIIEFCTELSTIKNDFDPNIYELVSITSNYDKNDRKTVYTVSMLLNK